VQPFSDEELNLFEFPHVLAA